MSTTPTGGPVDQPDPQPYHPQPHRRIRRSVRSRAVVMVDDVGHVALPGRASDPKPARGGRRRRQARAARAMKHPRRAVCS